MQGVLDPIGALSQLALDHGIPMHVDACVGGFVLPFVERLGYPVPPFDFRLPGVTSISADLHKYGFAAKGASVIVYRYAMSFFFPFLLETALSKPQGLVLPQVPVLRLHSMARRPLHLTHVPWHSVRPEFWIL